jgi:hypothetical protein
MASSSNSSGGIGFVGLLTIVFITLKLTHFIEWSWWWVLCPLWILPLFLIVVFALIAGIALIADSCKPKRGRY